MSSSREAPPDPPVERPVTAAELGELLVGAARAFSRHGQARFGEHGLSPARVRLLVTLGDASGVKMRDLAERLGVTARAVTPLVDAMAAEDLVARRPDPLDRRAFRLELTPAGGEALDRIRDLQATVSEEAFSALDEAERARLGRLLRTYLDATRRPDGDGC